LIWMGEWGIGKVFYLLSRYLPFTDTALIVYWSVGFNIPFKTCYQIYIVWATFTSIVIVLAHAVLVLRIYALSDRNKLLLIFLLLVYTINNVLAIAFISLFVRSLEFGPPPPNIPGCFPIRASNIAVADLIVLLISETVFMVTTLWIGVKRFRNSSSPLIYTMFRDGILYFFYLFALSVTNMILVEVTPPEFGNVLLVFQRTIHTVVATRLILHVREAATIKQDTDTMSKSASLRFSRWWSKMELGSTSIATTRSI